MKIFIVLALISISASNEKMRAVAFRDMCYDSSKKEYCTEVIALTKLLIMKREPGKFCPYWEENSNVWLPSVRTHISDSTNLMVGEVVEKILNAGHLCPVEMI